MPFIAQYLISQGISRETIILLVMLPVVVTIVAFTRQVVGLKGIDIYTPLIISFAFLVTGLQHGLILFTIILLVGTSMRYVAKHLRLLYLPRMALILSMVALVMLFVLLGEALLGLQILTTTSALATLIMIALVEKFILHQIQRGNKKAFILTLEILTLSTLCYWIISLPWIQNLVLIYPLWIIIASIIMNIFLGKWTGLRFYEYIRFREIIKRVELPGKK